MQTSPFRRIRLKIFIYVDFSAHIEYNFYKQSYPRTICAERQMKILTLGQKINTLRSEKGLTQKELATKLGITTGTIAEWEADESAPSLAELSRLCKTLNVSSDVLLEATTEEFPAPVMQPKQEPIPVVAPVKKHKKTGWIIGAIVVLVALAIGAAFLFQPAPFADNASAIEVADSSVVTIFCYDYEDELAATGSGFVAFDGKTIITNYHVMTSAYTCKISTNQDISYEVSKILCYSKEQDIAILQLEKDTGLQPLTLGDSSIIKKGETIVAIGSPLGIKNTVSTGVLSGRLMDTSMDVLQFTAPISSGSSGGALFDNNGNVIGITYASYIDGQNLNLAIPIELANDLYNSMGAEKNVSAIYIDEHPYIKQLSQYKDVPQITIDELLANPQKYKDMTVKVIGYYSSSYEFAGLFGKEMIICTIATDEGVTGDVEIDREYGSKTSSLHIIFSNIESFLDNSIQPGKQICCIGDFSYLVFSDGEIDQHMVAKLIYSMD